MTGIDEKFPARLSWSSIAAFLLEFAHTIFQAQTFRLKLSEQGLAEDHFAGQVVTVATHHLYLYHAQRQRAAVVGPAQSV